MPNLRIVSDNAIERAVLSASSSANTQLGPANLANDLKANIWRGLSKVERLDATWTTPEPIQAVGGPNCNWSPTATWRIRLSNEDTAQNFIRYSETFDNGTYWGSPASANVVAAAGIASPSGSLNVDKLQEITTTAEAHSVAQSVSGFAINEQVTFTIFAKQAERTFMSLKFDSVSTAAPATATVIFSLVTGNKYSETSGGWTFSIDPYLNDWWRIVATRTTTAAGVIRPIICTASSSTNSTQAGVVNSGIYIWGAMLTKGSKSSYYPNNTSSASSTRPAGYIDTWQSYDYDSGWVQACPAPAAKVRRLTPAQAASAYAFGGGAFARHWMPTEKLARRLALDISDPDNLQGFVELANLVAAPYWEAKKNADYGAEATPVDSTQVSRSGAGDLMATQSTRSAKLSFSLSKLDPDDRDVVWNTLRSNGVGYPVWLSLFPEDLDARLEAAHQIWGYFEQLPAMSLPSFRIASAKLTVQSS